MYMYNETIRVLLKQKVTSTSATYIHGSLWSNKSKFDKTWNHKTWTHKQTASKAFHSEELAEKHPLEQWLMEVLSTMYGGMSMVYEMNKLLLSYEIVALD